MQRDQPILKSVDAKSFPISFELTFVIHVQPKMHIILILFRLSVAGGPSRDIFHDLSTKLIPCGIADQEYMNLLGNIQMQ